MIAIKDSEYAMQRNRLIPIIYKKALLKNMHEPEVTMRGKVDKDFLEMMQSECIRLNLTHGTPEERLYFGHVERVYA